MYNSAYFSERYRVIRKIGAGGMSSVYLCVDKNIHKKWAIKRLENSADLSLAKSEIELLKSLDYYMFPRIIDAFTDNGKVCIVTDYIEGLNLSSYLKENGALPFEIAMGYFEELLGALNYLHTLETPILYLDMKASNIMLKPDGKIMLIDFGIAGSILLKSKSIGSIGYSPPEQYIEGAMLSEKSDVFALAITLYEMLTGKKPDKNLSIQREKIRTSKVIPATVKDMMLKCTEAEMSKRMSIDEIYSFLHKKARYEKGIIPVTIITIAVTSVFLFLVCYSYRTYRMHIYDEYRREMMSKASKYVDNGQYSREAIRIICGYIDGNFLDNDTKEKYIYEVAKYYFEEEKDYALAGIYFNRMDKEKYPEIIKYIRICNEMSSFDGSEEKLAQLMKSEIGEEDKEIIINNE